MILVGSEPPPIPPPIAQPAPRPIPEPVPRPVSAREHAATIGLRLYGAAPAGKHADDEGARIDLPARGEREPEVVPVELDRLGLRD